MQEEIWKDVKGFEGEYQCSNLGVIRNFDKLRWNGNGWQKMQSKIMKGTICKAGYLLVNLKNKSYYLHRVIAKTFITSEINGLDINHKNGVKTDNRIENLELCTRKENINHAFDTGLIKVGEKHHASKWSDETAMKIRRLFNTNLSVKEIKQIYFPEIPTTTIAAIAHGYNRKRHLQKFY